MLDVVVDVDTDELVVMMIPVVVNYHQSHIMSYRLPFAIARTLTLAFGDVVEGALVVTVPTVGAVVVFVAAVVDERFGSQMLKNQNAGSVIGADSGPTIHHLITFIFIVHLFIRLTTELCTTCHTYTQIHQST